MKNIRLPLLVLGLFLAVVSILFYSTRGGETAVSNEEALLTEEGMATARKLPADRALDISSVEAAEVNAEELVGVLKGRIEELSQSVLDRVDSTSAKVSAEVIEVAAERGRLMRQLIQQDPKSALESALPIEVIESLPSEIRELSERHVSGIGFYGVLAICNHTPEEIASPDHAHWEHEFRHEVVFNEESFEPEVYRAHVYGERLEEMKSEENAAIYGVAVGSDLAVAEAPVHVGQQSDGSWLVAAEGDVNTFASEGEAMFTAEQAEERLAAMDPEAGEVFDPVTPPTGDDPPWGITYDRYIGTNSHQKGVKTLLMIYANGADYQTTGHDVTPFRKSDSVIRGDAEGASRIYYDWSYRQTWFGNKTWSGTPGPQGEDYVPMVHVTPTVVLPNDASYYGSSTFGTTRSHLISAVRALGGEYASGGRLDPSNFDRITFYMRGTKFGNGLAYVRSNFFWGSHGIDNSVGIHELGHNWGIIHANSWEATTSGTGVARHPDNNHAEYGGAGDVMGGGGPFSVMFKQKLGFLEKSNAQGLTEVQEVITSGTYRLFDHTDVDGRNSTSAVRGLWIPITGFSSTSKHLVLGFRHYADAGTGSFYRTWGYNAVEVLSDGTSSKSSHNDGSHYIDTSPYSYYSDGDRPQGKGDDKDGAIPLGRTYSEPVSLNGNQIYGGFHITPVARGQATDDAGTPGDASDDTTHEWIDVKVVYNAEVASNVAPVITNLTASNTTPGTNENVTFNVTATDGDGDTLHYWWKFHQLDSTQDNQPQQQRSWSSPGRYYVTVHVSDGKGGLAIKGMQVDVGSPSGRYGIQGRVLRGGQPVVGAKLWIDSPSPGTEGDLWHDAFSESDGTYRFANLPPGTYRIRAVHPTFQEDIDPTSHTVVISSSSQFGRDFTFQLASSNSYNITGRVLYANPNRVDMDHQTLPLHGVTVSAGERTAITSRDGRYTISNVPSGDYEITAEHPQLRFFSEEVTVSGANASAPTIYPVVSSKNVRVYPPSGISFAADDASRSYLVLEGFPVQLGLDHYDGYDPLYETMRVPRSDNSVEPPADYPYSLLAIVPDYTATPSSFTNPRVDYSDYGTSMDFNTVASTAGGLVQGYVLTSQGVPVTGVNISDGTNSDTTDSNGFYQLITSGSGSVTVVPTLTGMTFSPANANVTMSTAIQSQNFTLASGIAAPTIATAAVATSAGNNPVVQLSVLGADSDDTEANLTYTWSKASGSGYVVFGANGSNTAKNSTVEVKASGTYTFLVTATDPAGNFVTSTTNNVTIAPQASAIIVSPGFSEVGVNTLQQFTAQGFDQFGDPLSVTPSWSVDGGGSIDPTGLLTASTQGEGYVVTATSGSVSGTGLLNVVPAKPVIGITSEGIGFTTSSYVFEVDASDPDGTVAKVEFFVDGSKIGEDTSSPFTFDIANPVMGQYTLYALATDNDGNTTGSLEKQLFISDPLPTVMRFNIQPYNYSPTPSGYFKLDQTDTAAFRNGIYYGWVGQTNKASDFKEWNAGSHASGGFPDEVHDTYVEMGRFAQFRARVPNGTYSVRILMTAQGLGKTNERIKVQFNGVELVDQIWNQASTPIVDILVEDIVVTDNWLRINNPQYNQLWSAIEITPDGPVMGVVGSGDGSEIGPQAINFNLTREANFTDAFTLNFSLNGTAVPADYTVTGATTWDPGTRTGTIAYSGSDTDKTVTVTPLQDSQVEGTETVQFKIEDGTGYAAATPIAEASILDAQTNYPPTASLVWPKNGTSISLDSAASHWVEAAGVDDGFGGSSLIYSWAPVSGPGNVTFVDANTAGTRVSFDADGTYVLRATVSDGSATDTVDATVKVGGATPTNGQLMHWGLNEGSGSTVVDDSGNALDGTTGANWSADGTGISGRAGDYAASFSNNASHQVARSNVSAMNPLSAFTVSLWVRPDATGTDRGLFSGRPLSEWNGVSGQGAGISMRYDAAGWFTGQATGSNQPPNVIQSQMTFPNDMQLFIETSPNVHVSGQWQHIVLTWERNAAPKYYINGVQDAATVYGTRVGSDNNTIVQNGTVDANIVEASAFVVGRGSFDSSGSWDGLMDEFRFYDRALSAEEVAALYSGSPTNTVPVAGVSAAGTADVNVALNLDGSGSDAETASGSLGYRWMMLSGPGTASFGDASAVDTTVTFDAAGTYVIALVADDGEMADGETLSVIVSGGGSGYDSLVFDTWFGDLPPGVVVDGSLKGFEDKANGVVANGMIYALGINSLDPADAVGKLPSVGTHTQGSDEYVELTFRQISGGSGSAIESGGYTANGVNYVVECSTTMGGGDWHTGTALLQVVSTISNGDGTDSVTVRVKQPVTTNVDGREFVRLKVVQQ